MGKTQADEKSSHELGTNRRLERAAEKRIAGFAARGHAPLKKPALATGTVTAGRFDIRKLGLSPPFLWIVFVDRLYGLYSVRHMIWTVSAGRCCSPTVARQQLPANNCRLVMMAHCY